MSENEKNNKDNQCVNNGQLLLRMAPLVGGGTHKPSGPTKNENYIITPLKVNLSLTRLYPNALYPLPVLQTPLQ